MKNFNYINERNNFKVTKAFHGYSLKQQLEYSLLQRLYDLLSHRIKYFDLFIRNWVNTVKEQCNKPGICRSIACNWKQAFISASFMARVPIIARYRHCTLHYSPVEAAISPRDIAYTLNSFINSSHRIQEPFALFDELYDKPWLRAGPYFIGTISGYILFKTKCQLKLPMVSISKHYPQRFCPIGLITQSINQQYSCIPRRVIITR